MVRAVSLLRDLWAPGREGAFPLTVPCPSPVAHEVGRHCPVFPMRKIKVHRREATPPVAPSEPDLNTGGHSLTGSELPVSRGVFAKNAR